MKKYDIYGAILWAGMAIFIIATAPKIGLGIPRSPGPGLFPLMVGYILLFFSTLMIIIAIHNKKDSQDFNIWPHFRGTVFFNFSILIAYTFLLEHIGFIISSLLLLIYLFRISGKRKWWFSIGFAFLIVSTAYYFFGILLSAQFPKGFFGIG